LPEDKALLCLSLLLEGNSLRSIQRITGVHKTTLMTLLCVAGERCERVPIVIAQPPVVVCY
jgi:hypothetical protein